MAESFMGALKSGQIMTLLFENIPGVYYFYKDRQSRFMGGSSGFARLMGEASIDSIIGKADHDFTPKFLADVFYADDQWVMETGKAIQNKIELVPAADGSLDWLCTTKVPLSGECGEVIGLAGTTRIIRDTESVYADHPEMRTVVEFVRENYSKKILAVDMAAAAGISVSSMERLFRRTFGLTPLMYLRRARLNAACRFLRDSQLELAEIAVRCGFNDQTNMTRAFRLELNITPLRYRRSFQKMPKLRGRRRSNERLQPGMLQEA
ncbi:MAG: helix-turn-helix domain-containing protein [Verrucomicrobia bacterium]|nr:helix-turn-helix domain-containing protein [Verrucomicrobiota bacterium]